MESSVQKLSEAQPVFASHVSWPGKLWLIDDEDDEDVLVRCATRMAGITVDLETFREPSEAIKRLESLRSGFPALIVCDFKLGPMSGLDFLDWLRASRFSMIPVIIRSNSADQRDVNAAYVHGANCYFQKGFDLDQVQRNFKLLLEFWRNMRIPEIPTNRKP